jgi:hypothetical protein
MRNLSSLPAGTRRMTRRGHPGSPGSGLSDAATGTPSGSLSARRLPVGRDSVYESWVLRAKYQHLSGSLTVTQWQRLASSKPHWQPGPVDSGTDELFAITCLFSPIMIPEQQRLQSQAPEGRSLTHL